MTTNVTVKTRIRVNGREYASVDDMPADVRQAYERAMATIGGTHHGLASLAGTRTSATTLSKIVFNGQEYAGVDQMPAEIRKLYEGVMATLDVENVGDSGAAPTSPTVIPALSLATGATRSESTTSRLFIAAAVVAALILASFVWGR